MEKLKASDLRIGNLFDVINRTNEVHLPTGIVLRIISIGLFDVQCIPNEVKTHEATSDIIMTIPIRDLLPIKLTEDWLIRFGFTQQGTMFNKVHNNGVIVVSIKDNSVGIYSSKHSYSVGYGYNMGKIRIKTVHALQNLYHALTNEELTIKTD